MNQIREIPPQTDILTGKEYRSKFVQTIEDLAQSGIGTDPNGFSGNSLMSDAFQGLLDFDKHGPELIDILVQAGSERQNTDYPMRPIHGSLVFIYAVNYLMMHRLNKHDYPQDFNLEVEPQNWQQVYASITKDPELLETLYELLLHKDLMTSTPRRGNDLPFIVKRIKGEEPVKFVDLGASLGLPWLWAINSPDGAQKELHFRDETSYKGQDQMLVRAAQNPIRAQEGSVFVDHTDPYQDIEWIMACRYPGEVSSENLETTKALIDKYERGKIRFQESNMMNPPFNGDKFDVVSAIMSGYELTREQQKELTQVLMPRLVTQNGLIIVKDYVEVESDTGELIFTNDRGPYKCATAVKFNGKWMIITEHSTSRCHSTRKGPDFDYFMEVTAKLPHNQL